MFEPKGLQALWSTQASLGIVIFKKGNAPQTTTMPQSNGVNMMQMNGMQQPPSYGQVQQMMGGVQMTAQQQAMMQQHMQQMQQTYQ